jgi:molecular chaperone GrpE
MFPDNATGSPSPDMGEGAAPFSFTDKRKVDPETNAPRQPQDSATDELADAVNDVLGDLSFDAPALADLQAENAKLTEDLQRKVAEYTNYRTRTQRDLAAARTAGVESVLLALLPVLDDVERARTAGELDGPMAAIATRLDETLARLGVERYGAIGDGFDPTIHEALMHRTDPDAESEAIEMVIESGYRIGDRIARAARVGTVGPN